MSFGLTRHVDRSSCSFMVYTFRPKSCDKVSSLRPMCVLYGYMDAAGLFEVKHPTALLLEAGVLACIWHFVGTFQI